MKTNVKIVLLQTSNNQKDQNTRREKHSDCKLNDKQNQQEHLSAIETTGFNYQQQRKGNVWKKIMKYDL